MKRVKASEITLAQSVRTAVSRLLAPIEAWENIEAPEAYLESRTGKYIRGLELVLDKFIEEGDLNGAKSCLNDLLRLTKVGRAKAEVTLTGVNKLRNETPMGHLSTEDLLKVLGREES